MDLWTGFFRLQMKKRILSLLLAIVMVAGLLPAMSLTTGAEVTGHTHCICGATHVAVGSHKVVDERTWTAINSAEDLLAIDEGGAYYLHRTDGVWMECTDDEAIHAAEKTFGSLDHAVMIEVRDARTGNQEAIKYF